MKKKHLMISFIILAITLNIQLIVKTNFWQIELRNIEALGDCESPVQSSRGILAYLRCTNPDGTWYSIPCCDFDLGYDDYCHGRNCGNK